MNRMRRLAEEAGREVPHAGVIPWVSPGRTREEALKALDVPMIISATEKKYGEPPNGRTGDLEDLDGGVIAGPPDVIIEEVRRYQEVGALHFVFDLRARFDDWEECLALLGEEVLPELIRGDATADKTATA
jgi:alkanesulfonate monooxygenase SsuD/methylene tetrahydromethanopterin reductase-like flavin-dependent oxidoreductase (luciferase family)